ncbi:MAG: hypothetical protein M3R24_42500 [Chloroflexota bacterium]|nr:hypothetical protein [Chloroflexota bacterium]
MTDTSSADDEVAFVEQIIEFGDILGIHLLDAMVVSRSAWTNIRLLHADLDWAESDG